MPDRLELLSHSKAESVQHGVGIVRDAVVRIGGFPHVDVRGLHVDERIDAFRVNGVHPGQDGEGPFHRRVAVVAECAKRVESMSMATSTQSVS